MDSTKPNFLVSLAFIVE
jgi:hypothetical protein